MTVCVIVECLRSCHINFVYCAHSDTGSVLSQPNLFPVCGADLQFRAPSHKKSPVSIHGSPDNPERIPWIIMRFRLYRKPLSLPKGSCWLPLLQSCTIAEMNQREKSWKADFHGLKLSFDLMIRMAAVEYPLRVNDKLVFCGYETALTPIRVEGRRAQFHLDISTSGQINPYLLQTESTCSSLDVKDFKEMVCYVGWCDVVHIRLGNQGITSASRVY
jgi:hypothetical protein